MCMRLEIQYLELWVNFSGFDYQISEKYVTLPKRITIRRPNLLLLSRINVFLLGNCSFERHIFGLVYIRNRTERNSYNQLIRTVKKPRETSIK